MLALWSRSRGRSRLRGRSIIGTHIFIACSKFATKFQKILEVEKIIGITNYKKKGSKKDSTPTTELLVENIITYCKIAI